mgnify:CR=1 FL=1
MKKKICSTFLIILIAGGIVMSVLNFSTKAYADPRAIYGTTWDGSTVGPLLRSWWHLNNRHLGNWGGTDWYCVFEPSDCVIVFAN